ncbi:hypothetical protein [Microbacterium sp. NPDC096154]|uniref:hypothetical protein n=1 Tax=Microbacterium sp. NPDC096154 TaxID=3155549 RepID=UPI00333486B5
MTAAEPPPAAPYVAPQDPRYAQLIQPPAPRRSRALGRVALLLSLIATAGASIVLAIALGAIGAGVGPRLETLSPTSGLEVLTPVRDWVLVGEIATWAGTVLGLWALVQGIVAVARDRGRGPAIAAIVIAALGPLVVAAAAIAGTMSGIAASVAP